MRSAANVLVRSCDTVLGTHTLQAGLAHEPGDPLDVHRQPQPEGQFGVHAW